VIQVAPPNARHSVKDCRALDGSQGSTLPDALVLILLRRVQNGYRHIHTYDTILWAMKFKVGMRMNVFRPGTEIAVRGEWYS
jgi:hypothetical protein